MSINKQSKAIDEIQSNQEKMHINENQLNNYWNPNKHEHNREPIEHQWTSRRKNESQ